jgi:integrase
MAGRIEGRSYRDTYTLPPAWDAAIAGWLRWLTIGGNSPATMRLRRGQLRMIARRSETQHPREVTFELLVSLCSAQSWSLGHRKGVRTSLISFYDWAIDSGVVDEHPAAKMPRVRSDSPRPRPATDEVWQDMLTKASPRERLMIRLSGEAGMRRAEVAVCHRDDLVQDSRGCSLIVHGKGNKQRVVPISDSLAAAILEHAGAGYLFPSTDRWGHVLAPHLSPHHVGKMIGNLMPPGWSMHKLRHRFATRAYRGSRNIRAVQMLLGHSSVATTERYTFVDDDEIRAAMMSAGYETDPPSFAS